MPAVLLPSCVRTVRALSLSRDCHQLKQALTPTVHRFSSFFDTVSLLFMVTAYLHISVRMRKKKGLLGKQKQLGVCVCVSSAVKCVWNMSIQPHQSLRWEAAILARLGASDGREGRTLIAGTQGRPPKVGHVLPQAVVGKNSCIRWPNHIAKW